ERRQGRTQSALGWRAGRRPLLIAICNLQKPRLGGAFFWLRQTVSDEGPMTHRARLMAERERDQAERADQHAPPGEQREAVALHVAEERLDDDPGAHERHRKSERD